MVQSIQVNSKQGNQERIKLNQTDICDRYGISKRTIARWCKKGLPCTRNGCSPEFWLDEVERWLEQQAQSASNPWGDKLAKSKQFA